MDYSRSGQSAEAEGRRPRVNHGRSRQSGKAWIWRAAMGRWTCVDYGRSGQSKGWTIPSREGLEFKGFASAADPQSCPCKLPAHRIAALPCGAAHHAAPRCPAQRWVALCFSVLSCTVLHCFAPRCAALRCGDLRCACRVELSCGVLGCICTALHLHISLPLAAPSHPLPTIFPGPP